MDLIRVLVHGAAGRMGQEVIRAVCREPGLKLVGAVDVKVTADQLPLPDGSGTVPFTSDIDAAIESCRPDIIIDFTIAKASLPAIRVAARRGINVVIGTTGFSAADLDEIGKLAEAGEVGIIAAPNFALGAVLMMHLANIAGKYMEHAEIIELHHDRKLDAPSGTARTTARNMATARGKPFLPPAVQGEDSPARGTVIEGIHVHSVRMPGYLSHQEVILGGDGQTLSIRHDQIGREAFMPGVMLAVKEAVKRKGFIYGLDKLLGL